MTIWPATFSGCLCSKWGTSLPKQSALLNCYSDMYTADEAFFSSTSPCVLPVTKVDKRQLGEGRPGPIVQELLSAWSESVGLDMVDQARRHA